ncbi:flagellar biosynthetic protein FliR [Pseudalkalibacillus caeni]|uniref:Flagellar biosynthetic protein FliR n=1 Tax=Exobacillus caeni TaxID=2574798 RepID=A0A5R9FAJ3_9BACL|nr:flagellar biosynthetic protein FliR [Pseudalkalibacillus caeni]TLS36645.1 flagellar type III secretion system protein FliR [Pseudalkalibacillus caeni]
MLEWINQLPILLLILVRLTAFFIAAPVFSMKGVPTHFKIGLGFFASLLVLTTVEQAPVELDLFYIFLIIKELFIGVSLGFIAGLILYTVQVAGAFIDFQMGFAIANVVDPQTQAQVPIIGNFKYMLSILFLLSVDGHHLLLDGVMNSYRVLPLASMLPAVDSSGIAKFIAVTFAGMFAAAFQIALPIAGSLFLVDIALGILARSVPQVNVFVVGLPLKIFIGFVTLLITLPTFFYLVQKIIKDMYITMGQLIRLLGG